LPNINSLIDKHSLFCHLVRNFAGARARRCRPRCAG
jgi:hypothetical protein